MRGTRALYVVAHVTAALAQLYTPHNIYTEQRTPNIANRSLDFVRNIREDLRRNNDDYAALDKRRYRLTGNKDILGKPELQKQIPKPKEIPNPKEIPKQEPLKGLTQKPSSAKSSVDSRRSINDAEYLTPVAIEMDNETRFRSGMERPRGYKKVRVDKLKRLIHKGKMRLREMAKTATTGITPVTETKSKDLTDPKTKTTTPLAIKMEKLLGSSSVTVHMSTRPSHHRHVTFTLHRDTRPRPPAVSSELEAAAIRELEADQAARSPSPDQLDMAPGRGSHIHIMRLKGHLCQRSVLHPEGPVYNSRGSSILPPHKPELAHGRQFPDTRAPHVLLPRCCNCCKKSVLGCQ